MFLKNLLSKKVWDSGWILSIFNITGLIPGTFSGAFADTIGHRRLLIFGIAMQAIGSVAGLGVVFSFGLAKLKNE